MDFKKFWQICKIVMKEWDEDHGPLLGAAISYYAVFSIIPLFVVFMGLAGFFTEKGAVEQEILRQVNDLFSARAAESVRSFLSLTQESGAKAASLFSVLLLLVVGSRVFVQLQIALNVMCRVDRRKGIVRNLVRKRLLSFAMVIGIGFFLLLFFIFHAAVQFLSSAVPEILSHDQQAFLWMLVSEALSVLLFSVFFALFYRYVPEANLRWKDVWLGSFLTALCFAAGRSLFALYFSRTDIFSVYGAAGSLVVIMVWIALSSHIFLLGAKFTHVYAKLQGPLQPKQPQT